MTAAEYFNFERSRVITEIAGANIKQEQARQMDMLHGQEVQRENLLSKITPGVHWVTIHWLLPYGDGFRAHCISGTVKLVKRTGLEMWVKSRPDQNETKIHGISQGDIVAVPFDSITTISEPVEDLYPEGAFDAEQ